MPKFPHIISAVGIELEGGFLTRRRERNPIGGGEWHGDGSVYMDGRSLWSGEAVSPPINTWTKFAKWVKDNYPNRVNRTCGTHLHLSFKNNKAYSAILAQDSTCLDDMENVLKDWAKTIKLRASEYKWLLKRLEGGHEYCRKNWTVKEQLQDMGCRYTWVNAQAWPKHGTLELRVLPAFWHPKRLLSACNVLLQWIDKYHRSFKGYEFGNDLETPTKRVVEDKKMITLKVPAGELLQLHHGDGDASALNRALRGRGFSPSPPRTRYPEFADHEFQGEEVEGV